MLSASDEVPEQGRDNSSGRNESRHEIEIIASKEAWTRATESVLRQQKPLEEMLSDKLLMVVEESQDDSLSSLLDLAKVRCRNSSKSSFQSCFSISTSMSTSTTFITIRILTERVKRLQPRSLILTTLTDAGNACSPPSTTTVLLPHLHALTPPLLQHLVVWLVITILCIFWIIGSAPLQAGKVGEHPRVALALFPTSAALPPFNEAIEAARIIQAWNPVSCRHLEEGSCVAVLRVYCQTVKAHHYSILHCRRCDRSSLVARRTQF
jgi:hypothetical protein